MSTASSVRPPPHARREERALSLLSAKVVAAVRGRVLAAKRCGRRHAKLYGTSGNSQQRLKQRPERAYWLRQMQQRWWKLRKRLPLRVPQRQAGRRWM
eukprot:3226034-Pleurochrysis_carterae.AAC.1